MTAKEQKIKEAYGKHWENIKDFVDENGWIDNTYQGHYKPSKGINYKTLNIEDCDVETKANTNNYYWRHKSLQGIENNNGWVKIESENDLPKKDCDVFVFINGRIAQRRFQIDISRLWINKSITHYQPIIKPLNPIY